jgi:ABC-type transporter Mla subunit MlaD
VATVFRPFSLVHQRQETFKALQAQSLAMPRVVESLQTLVDGLERRSQQLNAQLLDQQAQFHRDAAQAYTGLADRVGRSLNDTGGQRARTGESIKPVVVTRWPRSRRNRPPARARQ